MATREAHNFVVLGSIPSPAISLSPGKFEQTEARLTEGFFRLRLFAVNPGNLSIGLFILIL